MCYNVFEVHSIHYGGDNMILVYAILFITIQIIDNYRVDKAIRKNDADPLCTIKSDKWKRKNGLL